MRTVLFVSSTPLHSLWSLALASGPFANARCVLWAINSGDDRTDFIVEALRRDGGGPFKGIETVASASRDRMPGTRSIRTALRRLQAKARMLAPDLVLTGNDRTRQFQAIAHALPNAAIAYLDDGTASYVPLPAPAPSVLRPLKAWYRRQKRRYEYGFAYDKPHQLGETPRVTSAWVAFPAHVHPGLACKPLHRIEPTWLRSEDAQRHCADAVRLAGLEPGSLAGLDLLLLLPRDSQIGTTPGLETQLERVARAVIARGGRLAIKRHPRSAGMPLALEPGSFIDIPPRLPVEILAPLLRGTRVVGTMTSALIFLPWLGADVRVEAILPDGAGHHPVLPFYRALGIPAFAVQGG